MKEQFDAAPDATDTDPGGRILIVDDDPVVAGMLGVALLAAGHKIFEVNSGEAALARLAGAANAASNAVANAADSGNFPDIVILDIEMGQGMDGFEVCRRLRATAATRDLPVLFLSSHDELDDRLRAYDAGGSDFMAKPFVPDEVLRKARLAIRHKRRQEASVAEVRATSDTAMTALTSLGDSEVTLKFSRSALGCRTLRALAALVIEAMSRFGVNCHVQLRTPGEVLTYSLQGPASPLEESVIEGSKAMGRVFSFSNRLIVNYDSISLLITDMPIADNSLCGRIRDQAAMVAETAELAVGNIKLRRDAILRADELRTLADVTRQAVDTLRVGYREMQIATRLELETMTNTIEDLYVHLGLGNSQEFTISDTVHNAVDRVLTLFEGGSRLDGSFASIIAGLTRASEYADIQDDEPTQTVEIW